MNKLVNKTEIHKFPITNPNYILIKGSEASSLQYFHNNTLNAVVVKNGWDYFAY